MGLAAIAHLGYTALTKAREVANTQGKCSHRSEGQFKNNGRHNQESERIQESISRIAINVGNGAPVRYKGT